jgi:glutamine synthetase adenylyltransferase
MGEPDLGVFEQRYRAALATTTGYYAQLFTEGETLGSGEGNLVFTGSDDDPGTLETLSAMGFKTRISSPRQCASGIMAVTPPPAPRPRAPTSPSYCRRC